MARTNRRARTCRCSRLFATFSPSRRFVSGYPTGLYRFSPPTLASFLRVPVRHGKVDALRTMQPHRKQCALATPPSAARSVCHIRRWQPLPSPCHAERHCRCRANTRGVVSTRWGLYLGASLCPTCSRAGCGNRVGAGGASDLKSQITGATGLILADGTLEPPKQC